MAARCTIMDERTTMNPWNRNDRTFWPDGGFLQGWHAQKPKPDEDEPPVETPEPENPPAEVPPLTQPVPDIPPAPMAA